MLEYAAMVMEMADLMKDDGAGAGPEDDTSEWEVTDMVRRS